MTVLLPFFIISAIMDAAICLSLDMSGRQLWLLLPIYIACFLGLLLLYVLFCGFFSLFVDMKKPQDRVSRFWSAIVKYTMGLISVFFGARIHLEGEELIPEGRWLFVCNHVSGFDPIVSGWALRKHDLAFITKPSIMRIPIANKALHRACFMDIDRENDRAALKTIIRAAGYLKNDVTNIGIYPEGTRSRSGVMGEFRNGAFKIAQRAKVPVVVGAIKYSKKLSANFLRPADVYLKICRVISAGEAEQMKTHELGDEAKRCIMLENV